MSITIVIPVFNNWKHTHPLLFDLYNNFPQDTEIIVADDCSTDKEVMTGLNWWQTGLLKDRLRVIRNEKNVGFLRNSNFAISKASNEIVALISNDVRISDKTVASKLKEIFAQSTGFTLVGNRLLDWDTGWNTIDGKIYPYLEGFLLIFRKLDWDKLGGFDERFAPFDFEDVDLSTKFLDNGGVLVDLHADIVHLGAQTIKYSPEREARTRINQNKFIEKWKRV